MMEDKIAKIAQDCFQKCPTIVLGSGASISHGLPSMEDLSNHLCDKLQAKDISEEKAWVPIRTALSKGNNIEAVLDEKNLPETLLRKIIEHTWKCVNKKDMLLLQTIASNDGKFALGRLFSSLFNSTHYEIQVVTTNYDRVIEYACNSVGILFQTGFAPGYLQKWENTDSVQFRHRGKPSRVVKIWKVHGSLDWFRTADEQTIGLPLFKLPPSNYTPLIVTPGLNKYKETNKDPFRTTISGADVALSKANAFLCVGFGFRDQHIYPKIIERCRENNVPTIVLTQELTMDAKNFLKNKAGNNYMGIEKHGSGSKIYTPDTPEGIEIANKELWSLDAFNNLTI